jgi:DNA invertase Pin-like site-specific DNA recombinase
LGPPEFENESRRERQPAGIELPKKDQYKGRATTQSTKPKGKRKMDRRIADVLTSLLQERAITTSPALGSW